MNNTVSKYIYFFLENKGICGEALCRIRLVIKSYQTQQVNSFSYLGCAIATTNNKDLDIG
jgi:hypothetical protein